MTKRKKVRRTIHIYQDQIERLREYKKRVYHDEDAPVDAVIIRQALDEWLERQEVQNEKRS